jgi:hypothetical protein
MAELEDLEQEALDEQLLDVTPVPELPNVPQTEKQKPGKSSAYLNAHCLDRYYF